MGVPILLRVQSFGGVQGPRVLSALLRIRFLIQKKSAVGHKHIRGVCMRTHILISMHDLSSHVAYEDYIYRRAVTERECTPICHRMSVFGSRLPTHHPTRRSQISFPFFTTVLREAETPFDSFETCGLAFDWAAATAAESVRA